MAIFKIFYPLIRKNTSLSLMLIQIYIFNIV